MTATDELRRMLDERGVEHYDGTESTLWGYEDYNEFTGIYRFSADETSDGYMQVRLWRVTPEQAIAATLGVETCHIVKASRKYVMSDGTELFEDGCSVCNSYIGEGDNYCPNCGRKVVDA